MSEERDTLILCTKQPAMGGYALWWGPNRCGYHAEIKGAGRYTRAEAEEICAPAWSGAEPVPLAAAMELAHTVADQSAVLRHIAATREATDV